MDYGNVKELLPGYALNALDAVEAAEVEGHLPSCESCTAELRDLLESVAPLSQAAVPAIPPDHLKSRLLARIPSSPRREPERAGFFTRRYPLGYIALAAAALVMIVTVAAFTAVTLEMSGKIGSLERENGLLTARIEGIAGADDRLEKLTEERRFISYAMEDPFSEVVALNVAHESPDAKALLLVSHRDGVGVLMAFGLTALPHGDHHDVWLSTDDSRHMMGSFSVDETGWGVLTIAPDKPLAHFDHISVTPRALEETPSSEADPVLWGPLKDG